MRISDWSSDVCSSDLTDAAEQTRSRGDDPRLKSRQHEKGGGKRHQPAEQPVKCRTPLEKPGNLPVRRPHQMHDLDRFAMRVERRPGGEDYRAHHRQRSEEHQSELQSLMRISYAVF